MYIYISEDRERRKFAGLALLLVKMCYIKAYNKEKHNKRIPKNKSCNVLDLKKNKTKKTPPAAPTLILINVYGT